MGLPRSQLHDLLLDIIDDVYFQPPESLKIVKNCIVYHRDYEKAFFAENLPYGRTKRYQITYISQDPDDSVKDGIEALPMCVFDRFFTANNLNHDVYKLFF